MHNRGRSDCIGNALSARMSPITNLFDRPTPRLVDGLEYLARRIHPELFGFEPMENEN